MKILFLYKGTNSGTNMAVFEAWRRQSAEIQVEAVDVADLVGRFWRFRPSALREGIRHGGLRILLRGRERFLDAVKRTRWMMEETDRAVQKLLHEQSYDVSFAMQTLIPVFHPSKPHFVYTDLCIKANALYPVGVERLELWKDCIDAEERGLRACTGVFVMSEHVKQVMIEDYGVAVERVHRVNGGCNSAVEDSFHPERYRRKNILFIGTDWQIKAGDHLVRAFQIVRGRHPDATLTIVGCRPDVSGPGIKVVGPVPSAEIGGYLTKASLFCMVSLREAFGIAYIEAMQAGLPVIAADLGATPDFVINDVTGYRVGYDDLDGLVQRLDQLLADPDLCEHLGAAGRELAMSEYTWEASLNKMADLVRAAV